MEASDNPFATVVLAHLKALETRRDPRSRREWKFRLVRGLYERGFAAEDVRQLMRVIDWLMELPKALTRDFWREVDEYEEGRRMPYYTSLERHVMLKMIEGLLDGKFGAEGAALMPAIEDIDDGEKYIVLSRAIANATTLEEVRRACAKAAEPPPRRKKAGRAKREDS